MSSLCEMNEGFRSFFFNFFHYIPTTVYVAILALLCLGILVVLSLKGLTNGWRSMGLLFLIAYLCLLYCSTIIFRFYRETWGCNYQPFWSYKAILNGQEGLIIENIMNILAFVPLGILLGWAIKRIKWWGVLIAGLCVSASIESLQYIFRRGFSEFDDILHNVIGCMIGYCLYKALIKAIAVVRSRTKYSL